MGLLYYITLGYYNSEPKRDTPSSMKYGPIEPQARIVASGTNMTTSYNEDFIKELKLAIKKNQERRQRRLESGKIYNCNRLIDDYLSVEEINEVKNEPVNICDLLFKKNDEDRSQIFSSPPISNKE